MQSLNYTGITAKNWKEVPEEEVLPGIFQKHILDGEAGKKAHVLEFKPGAKYPGIHAHEDGPEQLYIISGVFNDGQKDYPEGSFINNPKGTSHIPQTETGCTVLVLLPEG